jgi:hypothetical protein
VWFELGAWLMSVGDDVELGLDLGSDEWLGLERQHTTELS